jgi:hypothetical protein
LSRFGLNGLQDLPDRESIENTGIVSSGDAERGNLDDVIGISGGIPEDEETFEEAEL